MRLQFLLLAFCLIFLVFAGKTGDDPRPVQKDGERNDNFRRRMARWKKRNNEADEDDLALVAHENALANSALSTAREQESNNATQLSTIQIDRLSRYRLNIESNSAALSASRKLRKNDPSALTERDLRILAPTDALTAELSASRKLRKNDPSALTERDLRILAPTDAMNAERAAKNAELGRQSQAAHMGMEVQIHTPPESASILAHILQALNLILLAFPRAAIYVGSVSFNFALLSTLTLRQMIEHHISRDAQCFREGGRGGTFDPLLRFDVAGNFLTTQQFLEAGGFLQIVHYTVNPSHNGLEHALQLLQRQHNTPLIGGAILNGGYRASGNLPTTAGRICQTALLVLPDRTRLYRFQGDVHVPWPANLDDVPRISLGDLPDPMPLRVIPHLGEAYLHINTNMTQMHAKVVADLVPLIADRSEYIPVLTDTWNGIVTPDLRVLNTGFRFANDQLLRGAMGRLGIVQEDDVRRSNLVVVSDNMLTGVRSASNEALAARENGVPITSISKFNGAVHSADGMMSREEATSSSAVRSQRRNNTSNTSSSSSAYPPLFSSSSLSSSSSLTPSARTSGIGGGSYSSSYLSSLTSLGASSSPPLPRLSFPRPSRTTTTMFDHFSSMSSSGISSSLLPSTLSRDRTGIDNVTLLRLPRPIVTVDFVDSDDDDDDFPLQQPRRIPVIFAHQHAQEPRLSIARSNILPLRDFLALSPQEQVAMNANLPQVPFDFTDFENDVTDDEVVEEDIAEEDIVEEEEDDDIVPSQKKRKM